MIEEVKILTWRGDCYPPEDLSVLLYIEIHRQDPTDENLTYYLDYRLVSGFYSSNVEEEPGYFLDTLAGYEKIIETQYMKVRKWTLLPKPPKHNKRWKLY